MFTVGKFTNGHERYHGMCGIAKQSQGLTRRQPLIRASDVLNRPLSGFRGHLQQLDKTTQGVERVLDSTVSATAYSHWIPPFEIRLHSSNAKVLRGIPIVNLAPFRNRGNDIPCFTARDTVSHHMSTVANPADTVSIYARF